MMNGHDLFDFRKKYGISRKQFCGLTRYSLSRIKHLETDLKDDPLSDSLEHLILNIVEPFLNMQIEIRDGVIDLIALLQFDLIAEKRRYERTRDFNSNYDSYYYLDHRKRNILTINPPYSTDEWKEAVKDNWRHKDPVDHVERSVKDNWKHMNPEDPEKQKAVIEMKQRWEHIWVLTLSTVQNFQMITSTEGAVEQLKKIEKALEEINT